MNKEISSIVSIQKLRNCKRIGYNCGGFALSQNKWVTPYYNDEFPLSKIPKEIQFYTCDYRFELMNSQFKNGEHYRDICNTILEKDCEYLTKVYPFLNQVTFDTKSKGKLIAYRIFIEFDDHFYEVIDNDFHFKIRINNKWYEKNGEGNIHSCSLKNWNYPSCHYNSRTIYFIDNR